MAYSVAQQVRRVRQDIDFCIVQLAEIDLLDGAHNPEASLRGAHQLCLALNQAILTSAAMRKRFEKQLARKGGSR